MAKSINLVLPQNHTTKAVTFTSADTTVAKLIIAAGSDDTDLKFGRAVSDDTAIINLRLYLRKSAVNYAFCCVRIAAGSGTDGATAPVDLWNATANPGLPLDQVFKPYFQLKAGDEIWGACLATMTVGKTLTITKTGDDF